MTLIKNGVNQWIRVPGPESRVSARPGWYGISPSVVFFCSEEHIEYLLDADGLSRVEYRPAPVFLKEDRDHDNLYKGGFNRREGAEDTLSLRPLRLLRARCG